MPGKKKFIVYGVLALIASYSILAFAFLSSGKNIVDTPLVDLPVKDSVKTNMGSIEKEPEPAKAMASQISPKDEITQVLEPSSLIDEEEKDLYRPARKEGELWFDGNSPKGLVTLGSIDGLEQDSLLYVYEGNVKIGEAKVDKLEDIISYVDLVWMKNENLKDRYYKVSIP